MNLLLAATLLLASVANINADAADTRVPGLRGVDIADAAAAAADGAVASRTRRHLQNSLGDWAFCTSSYQCKNQCCSSKYSTSDGRLKCTPVGGFKPSEGCVGSATPPAPTPTPPTPTPPPPSPTSLKGDWQLCSTSKECLNGCCSSKYSTSDGLLKCTPVGGFKPSEGCVESATSPSPRPTPVPTRTPPTPPTSTPPTPLPTRTPPTPLPTPLSTQTPGFKTLQFLKEKTGTVAVAGVHNRVNADVNWNNLVVSKPFGPSAFTNYTQVITGKFPGLWSGDFLHDWPNNSLAGRKRLIEEAAKQYEKGALVNIMYHACNPRLTTRREEDRNSPEFGELLDANCNWDDTTNGPKSKLSDDEWTRLLTDGNDLNRNWKGRLDLIAQDLKVLKDKNVEVMFRPLHEMNQGDFWWGGRSGSQGTRRLYQITHDYLTKTKGLTNLIWVWNVQDLAGFSDELVSSYNPGDSYWDVVTLDIYEGFDEWKHEVMNTVRGNKPMGIGECNVLPSVEILTKQPNWSFFMSWSEETFFDFEHNQVTNTDDKIKAVYNSDRVITLEEMPGWK
jgi:mannan endo-1,4-beta-mannosidase